MVLVHLLYLHQQGIFEEMGAPDVLLPKAGASWLGEGGQAKLFIAKFEKVRKAPNLPRSWANFSVL